MLRGFLPNLSGSIPQDIKLTLLEYLFNEVVLKFPINKYSVFFFIKFEGDTMRKHSRMYRL